MIRLAAFRELMELMEPERLRLLGHRFETVGGMGEHLLGHRCLPWCCPDQGGWDIRRQHITAR